MPVIVSRNDTDESHLQHRELKEGRRESTYNRHNPKQRIQRTVLNPTQFLQLLARKQMKSRIPAHNCIKTDIRNHFCPVPPCITRTAHATSSLRRDGSGDRYSHRSRELPLEPWEESPEYRRDNLVWHGKPPESFVFVRDTSSRP